MLYDVIIAVTILLAGLVLGAVFAARFMHKFADGYLVIDRSSGEAVPFMEIKKDAGDIFSRRYIVLAVEHRNYVTDVVDDAK